MFDEKEIPKFTRQAMYAFAILVDIIQIVLVFFAVGILVDYILLPSAQLILYVWFSFYNVKFTSPKSFVRIVINWIIGLIPAIGGAYPETTITVSLLLHENKKVAEARKLQEAEQLEMQMQQEMQMQMSMQQQTYLVAEQEEEEAAIYEEEERKKDEEKKKKKASGFQYADFEDPSSSKVKPFNPATPKQLHTLDLRRNEDDEYKKAA